MMSIEEINELFRSAPAGIAKGWATAEQAAERLKDLGEAFKAIDWEDTGKGGASAGAARE